MKAENRPFLPYGRHLIDDDDVAAVSAVLRSDFLTTGPVVEEFEKAFARKVGAGFAVACSSGTAALHLAAMALGLGEGDTVIVPSITFLATANAARFVGAEVAFADVDPDTGLLTAKTLAAVLERLGAPGAKAVIPVHLAGQCTSMPEIASLAAEHGLAVIEDACHAIGATYADGDGGSATVGQCRHSRMAVFSLHPVKTITMGEGGVVTTNDEDIYRQLLTLRNHGMTTDSSVFVNDDLAFEAADEANPWYYEMQQIGYNYRASAIHCALGLSQLGKLDGFAARRRVLVERYDRLLDGLSPMVRPLARVPGGVPAWHLYVVLIEFAAAGLTRRDLMERLRARGIGTQVHYIPVHEQPYYRGRYGHHELPGADAYYVRALSLPLFPTMSDEDVDRVVGTLENATANGGGEA